MFGGLLGWYTIYILGGCCFLMEFCQVQNSLCIQVLRYLILAPLLHCTRAVGVSLTLQRGIFMFDIGSWTVISWLCYDYCIILRLWLCVVHMRQYNVVRVAQHRCSGRDYWQIHWYVTNMQLALLLACLWALRLSIAVWLSESFIEVRFMSRTSVTSLLSLLRCF